MRHRKSDDTKDKSGGYIEQEVIHRASHETEVFASVLIVQEETKHNVHLFHGLFLTCTQQTCNFFVYDNGYELNKIIVNITLCESLLGGLLLAHGLECPTSPVQCQC
jgi:hypothetical protein